MTLNSLLQALKEFNQTFIDLLTSSKKLCKGPEKTLLRPLKEFSQAFLRFLHEFECSFKAVQIPSENLIEAFERVFKGFFEVTSS